jgi:hypothetical protein
MTLAVIPGCAPDAEPGKRHRSAMEYGGRVLGKMIGGRLRAQGACVAYPLDSAPDALVSIPGTGMRGTVACDDDSITVGCAPCPPLPWPGALAEHLSMCAAATLGAGDCGRLTDGRPECGSPLVSLAGRSLRGAGLTVSVNADIDHDNCDVLVTLRVVNPRLPRLGTAVISDDASANWEWPYPCLSGAVEVADIAAGAVTRSLSVARTAEASP